MLRASLSSACLMIILLVPQQRMLRKSNSSVAHLWVKRSVPTVLLNSSCRLAAAGLGRPGLIVALHTGHSKNSRVQTNHYSFFDSRVGEYASQLVRGHVSQVPMRPQNSFAQFRRQRVVTFPTAPVEAFTAGAGDLASILSQDVPLLLLPRLVVSFAWLLILAQVWHLETFGYGQEAHRERCQVGNKCWR